MRALALLLAAGVSFAPMAANAQAIFSGDCERARSLNASTPMRDRFFGSYRGITRFTPTNDTCGRDEVRTWELRFRSANASQVVYDFTAKSYRVGNRYGTCADPYLWNGDLYGTMTFTAAVEQKTGYCDLKIYSDMTLRDRGDASYSASWTQNVFFFDSNHFGMTAVGVDEGSMFFR